MRPNFTIRIENKTPTDELGFSLNEGELVSDNCEIQIKVKPTFFAGSQQMINYKLELKNLSPSFVVFENGDSFITNEYFNVDSVKIYTYSFKLLSKISYEDLKIQLRTKLRAILTDLDATNRKKHIDISWRIE